MSPSLQKRVHRSASGLSTLLSSLNWKMPSAMPTRSCQRTMPMLLLPCVPPLQQKICQMRHSRASRKRSSTSRDLMPYWLLSNTCLPRCLTIAQSPIVFIRAMITAASRSLRAFSGWCAQISRLPVSCSPSIPNPVSIRWCLSRLHGAWARWWCRAL